MAVFVDLNDGLGDLGDVQVLASRGVLIGT